MFQLPLLEPLKTKDHCGIDFGWLFCFSTQTPAENLAYFGYYTTKKHEYLASLWITKFPSAMQNSVFITESIFSSLVTSSPVFLEHFSSSYFWIWTHLPLNNYSTCVCLMLTLSRLLWHDNFIPPSASMPIHHLLLLWLPILLSSTLTVLMCYRVWSQVEVGKKADYFFIQINYSQSSTWHWPHHDIFNQYLEVQIKYWYALK